MFFADNDLKNSAYLCNGDSSGLKAVSGNSHHARVGDRVYQYSVNKGVSSLAADLKIQMKIKDKGFFQTAFRCWRWSVHNLSHPAPQDLSLKLLFYSV